MKKNHILTFILSTLITLSCTSSDEPIVEQEVVDLTTAKWFLNQSSFNNEVKQLTSCEKQAFIEFKTDGTFERVYYYSSNGTNCLPEPTITGTFVFNETTNKITLNITTPEASVQMLNNVNFTASTFEYTWDEDGNGTDDVKDEYIK